MNKNSDNNQMPQSVVAIARTDETFRAVELRKQNGAYEILFKKTGADDETSWQHFASECGLSIEPMVHKHFSDNRSVVVGYDSTAMAFYRVKLPAVEENEIEAMVRLQAETLLPLPAEQMELTWRTNGMRNGQVSVTMAAARKEYLKKFVETIWNLEPSKILLNSEAIVKVWKTLFSGNERNAVVMSMGQRNTNVCLVEDGRLSNAVVLDMGIADISVEGAQERSEADERFAIDMKSVLELFGYSQSNDIPVFVMSDGDASYVSIVSSLRLAGLNARVASPDVGKLKSNNEHNIEEIYRYRVPIGLGIMALESSADELDIFKYLYNPADKRKKKYWFYSLKLTGSIAAVTLILFALISYALLIAKASAIEKHLNSSETKSDINQLVERQKLIKTVAAQRPDLLELISEINECGQIDQGQQRGGPRGGQRGGVRGGQRGSIQLESIHFKKGQMVTITGQATSNDQLYRFEKNLEESKNIRDVNRTAVADARSRQLKFTITFHYKNFTK